MRAEQSRGHSRPAIVAAFCSLLVVGASTVGSSAAPGQRRDEIAGVRVVKEGPRHVALDVDYTYSQVHKTVYAGAWALRGGQQIVAGYVPVLLSNWSGTTTIRIESDPAFSGMSDSFEVFLYEGGTPQHPFVRRRCAFPGTWGAEPPHPYVGPDLVVSRIDVYPEKYPKRAGQPFAVNVAVRNKGTVPSGHYDIFVQFIDVMRGHIYPRGGIRAEPMQPGEDYAVYIRNDEIVNNPGFYRVRAEIVPFLFHEPSTCNNVRLKDFFVE